MTMEQITEQAERMHLSPALMDLLAAAFEAGTITGVTNAAIDLQVDGNDEGVELLTANYPIKL